MTRKIVLVLIRAYQVILSSVLGQRCRFFPSCSHYASEAVETHGVTRGLMLSARRICKCHPFHPGGYDPVPPADGCPADQASVQEGT